MKTRFYLSAMMVATLVLGGCSQDEVLNESPNAQQKAIEFGVYSGNAAEGRATITNDASIKANGAGFGVNAVYTNETSWNATPAPTKKANFMWNQQVVYDGADANTWSYNPLKYWPTNQNDKISFFAYAPYQSDVSAGKVIEFTNNDTDASKLTYNHQADLSNNVDFVAASAVDCDEADNHTQTINFTLKHELTRLSIKAKVDEEVWSEGDAHKKTQVVITDMKFAYQTGFDAKLYKSATYTFNQTTGANADAVGSWEGKTEVDGNFDLNSVLNYEQVTVGTKTYNSAIALKGYSDDQIVDLCGTGNHFFMIPAIPTTRTGTETGITATGINLVVTYDIVTVDDKLDPKYSCTTATKTVPIEIGSNDVNVDKLFQQGVAYNGSVRKIGCIIFLFFLRVCIFAI